MKEGQNKTKGQLSAELQGLRKQFNDFLDEFPDALLEVDIKQDLTHMNRQAQKLFGYTAKDVAGGIEIPQLFGKNEYDRAVKIINSYMAESQKRKAEYIPLQEQKLYEFAMRRKDGSIFQAETQTSFVLDGKNGRPTGLRTLIRNITERKSKELNLRLSEERLRFLFEFAPDAYYLNDLAGTFIDGNRAAEEITGYKREELIGKNFLKLHLLPPNELIKAAGLLAKNAMGRTTGPDEFNLKRKDGNRVVVEIRTHPVKIKNQRLVLGIARDITQRKQAEEALRKVHGELEQQVQERTVELKAANARLQLTQFSVDHAADAAFWVRSDAQFIYVNEAACRSLGYKRKELLSMTVHEIDPAFPAEIWPEHWKDLKLRGSITLETTHRCKDGRIFPVEVLVNYLEFQGKGYHCVFARNITERKRTEGENKTLAHAIRSISECVCVTDMENNIIFVNAAFLKTYGYEKHELLGKSISMLRAHNDPAAITNDIVHATLSSSWQGELLNKRKNGTTFPVYLSTSVIYDENENPIAFIGVAQDITERKQMEAEVERQKILFQTIMNESNQVIFIKKAEDLSHVWMSKKFEEAVGISRNEAVGKTNRELFGEEIGATFDAIDREVLSGRRIEREESPDGERSYWTQKFTIKLPDGNIYLCGMATDITERKQAEQALRNALAELEQFKNRLQEENIYLRDEIKVQHQFRNIIGQSEPLKKVLRQVEQVAATDSNVLILGETGTGKELIARGIHEMSLRKERPLVKLNCATLPANLIESELFGHEKGAFTGALSRRIGRFELAHEGTIFLDEIGDLPLDLQVKLLRVLQEGDFERLGSHKTIKVDVRIIAATNRDIEKHVQEGAFREDLFFRLNVFPIYMPPLRDRREDIPLLVKHFIERHNAKLGKKIDVIPTKVMNALQTYNWPGNVRELENIIERAMVISTGSKLDPDEWFLGQKKGSAESRPPQTLRETEKQLILETLDRTMWRVSGRGGVAEILGTKPTTLESKMKKLGIKRPK